MTPSDGEQIDAVVAAIERLLGNNVVGIYRYGSGTQGGLGPHSDLDVLVVIDRPMSAGQRKSLVAEIMRYSGPRGSHIAGRPVEVTVLRRGAVSPWRPPLEREFQYGEWLRDEYEAGKVPAPQADDDIVPLLFTALHGSETVAGPPLDQVIDPIPHEDLVTSMRAGVPALLAELADDTRNVLLTLARIWYTTGTGDILSKDAAAAWAAARLPPEHSAVLAHARTVYLGEQEEDFDSLEAGPLATAETMAERIFAADTG